MACVLSSIPGSQVVEGESRLPLVLCLYVLCTFVSNKQINVTKMKIAFLIISSEVGGKQVVSFTM